MAPSPNAPTLSWDARAGARTTQAPSADALELRLRAFENLQARAVSTPACAVSCLSSAVAGLTPCSPDDDVCKCAAGNAIAIEEGAYGCLNSECGFVTAAAIWSVGADYCSKVRGGQITPSGGASSKTVATAQATGGGVVYVTSTLGNGQLKTSTIYVSSPTDGSSSGSDSNGNTGSGSNSNGSSTSANGSSLGTGAIAGIAVGSAAAVAIICLVAFLLYRHNRKKHASSTAHATEPKEAASPTPPALAAAAAAATASAPGVLVPGQPESDGKPGVFVQPQPAVSPIMTTPSPGDQRTQATDSGHPSVVSSLSPAPHQQHPYPSPPGVPELQSNSVWQQHHQPQQFHATPPPGYAVQTSQPHGQPQLPGQQVQHHPGVGAHYEMGVMPPELQPNATQFMPELHAHGHQHAYGGYMPPGVYEMSGPGPGQGPGQGPGNH